MSAQRKAAPTFRGAVCLLVLMGGIVTPTQQPARAETRTFDTASEGFAYQWDYSDRAVAVGAARRTWLWGPAPLGPARPERMVGSPARGPAPANNHLVQYFDKARMEFNVQKGIVTNGRLVVEMMSGGIQTSLANDDYFHLLPSSLPIAGDTAVGVANRDTPTYASLFSIANIGGNGPQATPRPVGTRITATYARSGAIGTVTSTFTPTVGTFYPPRDLDGHNIPNVFVEFLTQKGPVSNGPPGQYRTDYLFEGNHWVTAVGLPITEPYWMRVRIGGRDYWVLFQAFERRILTYNPSTPDPLWRVEMGNVGQHYKDWRPEPLVASPLQGVRVVQSSPDPTSDVCFGDGAIDGSCPPGQLVTLPRSFLTTLRSENSWARTKPSGWMLLHSDNAIYDMQSSAMLVFKRIDNSVDSVQQQGGQVDYLHGLKRRIEVETGVGFVTTYGTLFSIILPSAVQAVGEQLRIVVPRGRGSVTLQPPSPGSGLSPPAPIVVQSGQVLIAIKNQSVSYSIRSTNPSEEQYAADKLNRLGSIPGLEELTWLGAGEAGMPPPPTVTRTPIPTSSTGTPTPTSIPTPGTITPSPTMPPQTCSTLYGSITNSDPVQIGRLTSSLIPSPCNVYGLPCLGIVDTNARHYKRYNFHFPFGSFSTQCITVRIDATGCPGNLFSAAYITDFDGNNICTNLHGATGDVVSDSASYQFVVYRGYDFSIVVHEASPNSGCSNYALTISTDTACNNIITGAATPTRTSTPTAPPQSPTRTPTSLTPPGAGR